MLFLGASFASVPAGIVPVFIASLMVKRYSALHFSTESFEDKPLHDLGKLSELSLKLREIESVTG